MTATTPAIQSWTIPTSDDEVTWARLTREQQLAAYQALFATHECTTPTNERVSDILARIRSAEQAERPAGWVMTPKGDGEAHQADPAP